MKWMFALVAVMGLAVSGCQSGGEGGLPPERSTSTVSGYSVDAIIRNGTIKVFGLNSDATKGEFLGSTTTDENGYYELSLRSVSLPVLIEVTGGTYIEEASGKVITLATGDVLRAITFYESGEPLSVMVTPLTNLAAGLVVYKVGQGVSLNNAIVESSTAISSYVGFDILDTVPRDVTNPVNYGYALDDGMRYGLFTAAISSWTKHAGEENLQSPHTIYTSIRLASIMYDDISSDGLLDGKKVTGEGADQSIAGLSYGAVPLGPNVYRSEFANHMLTVVSDTSINKTGLVLTDLLPDAQAIANSGHRMFTDLPPQPIDKDAPRISQIDPEGQWYSGAINYEVKVSDFVGVAEVTFDIDGDVIGLAPDPSTPSVPIITDQYSDGEHYIGVRARDFMGNEAYEQFLVNFNSTGPVINVTVPAITNQASYEMAGTWEGFGVALDYLSVQGNQAVINSDGTWSATVDLAAGSNVIPIETMDELGNKTELEYVVDLDQSQPKVTVIYSDAFFSLGGGDTFVESLKFAEDETYPLYISADKVRLNGLTLNTSVMFENGIPNIEYQVSDPIVNGVATPADELTVEIRYSRGGEVLADWHPAQLTPHFGKSNYMVALVEETLAEGWHLTGPLEQHLIEARITDHAGNVRKEKFNFLAEVYPVASDESVTVSEQWPALTETSFAQRGSLYGQSGVRVVDYQYQNNSPFDQFIQITDEGHHYVESTAERVVRKHNVRHVTASDSKVVPYDRLEFPYFGDLLYACQQYQHVTVSVSPHSGNEGTFWVVCDPGEEWGHKTTLTYGDYQEIKSDNLSPAENTEWIAGEEHEIMANKWYHRTRSWYESEPGYPKNVVTEFTESASFDTADIQVFDEAGNARAAVSGWYKVMAGERVNIVKYVDTPILPLHTDIEVADLASFASYNYKTYDKSVSWKIDGTLDISVIHGNSFNMLASMPRLALSEGRGSITHGIAR